jgi:hypothetical protein
MPTFPFSLGGERAAPRAEQPLYVRPRENSVRQTQVALSGDRKAPLLLAFHRAFLPLVRLLRVHLGRLGLVLDSTSSDPSIRYLKGGSGCPSKL